MKTFWTFKTIEFELQILAILAVIASFQEWVDLLLAVEPGFILILHL